MQEPLKMSPRALRWLPTMCETASLTRRGQILLGMHVRVYRGVALLHPWRLTWNTACRAHLGHSELVLRKWFRKVGICLGSRWLFRNKAKAKFLTHPLESHLAFLRARSWGLISSDANASGSIFRNGSVDPWRRNPTLVNLKKKLASR